MRNSTSQKSSVINWTTYIFLKGREDKEKNGKGRRKRGNHRSKDEANEIEMKMYLRIINHTL